MGTTEPTRKGRGKGVKKLQHAVQNPLFTDNYDLFLQTAPLDHVFAMIRERAQWQRTRQVPGASVLRDYAESFWCEHESGVDDVAVIMLAIANACLKRIAGMWLADHPEWMQMPRDTPQH